MAALWPQRVLILYEGAAEGGDFGGSFANGFRAHGCDVTLLPRSAAWREPFDLALAYGPFSADAGMFPVARCILGLPPERRPIFAWWLTEGVPVPWLPRWPVSLAARARLALDRLGVLRARAHRLRILGELQWLHAHGMPDVLAVTSFARAAYLERFGLRCAVIPLGYDPAYCGYDLGLPRDIDIAFVGSVGTGRRKRVLDRLTRSLHNLGINLSLHESLYGDARTRILNRTRILLNVLRAPQDFVGQRFLLAAANKALIISEPLLDPRPFVAGRHLVTAPLAQIVDRIVWYLAHEPERRAIAEAAHQLVTRDLTITGMIARILDRARQHYAVAGGH